MSEVGVGAAVLFLATDGQSQDLALIKRVKRLHWLPFIRIVLMLCAIRRQPSFNDSKNRNRQDPPTNAEDVDPHLSHGEETYRCERHDSGGRPAEHEHPAR